MKKKISEQRVAPVKLVKVKPVSKVPKIKIPVGKG